MANETFCSCHSGIKVKIEDIEKGRIDMSERLDKVEVRLARMENKISLILGGVVISPFIVSVLMLLLKIK